MDFWNRKKVAHLEEENRRLRTERDNALSRVEDLAKRISGQRVCGAYCEKCKHGFRTEVSEYVCIGSYRPWICLLDCKCSEFEKKEGKA